MLHLSQQGKERLYLDDRKRKARMMDDFGNPYSMLIFPDGMTQYTTRVPIFGAHHKSSKTERFFESRIVGI
jgi:hypothetical protein